MPAASYRSVFCLALTCMVPATETTAQSTGPRLAPLGVSHPPDVVAPQLQLANAPLLGAPIRLDLVGGLPFQTGILAIGHVVTNPLVLGTGHSIYLHSPSILQPFVLDSAGEQRPLLQSGPLPPALLGIDLGGQAALFDSSLPDGFLTTRALEYRLAQPISGPAYQFHLRGFSDKPTAGTELVDLDNDGSPEEVTFTVDLTPSQLPNPVTLTVQTYDGWLQDTPRIDLLAGMPTSFEPRDLDSGDFDGDGNADLVFTDPGQGRLVILPGNGNRTFAGATTLSGLSNPTECAVLDFDGDGDADIAVTNQPAAGLLTVVILPNDGVGGFGTPFIAVSRTLAGANNFGFFGGLIGADFNNDGRDDLLTFYREGAVIPVQELLFVYGTNNLSTPAPSATLPIQEVPSFLEAGQLDSDGRLDLVLAVRNSANGAVPFVLFSNPSLPFPLDPPVGLGVPPGPTDTPLQSLIVADVDGSGLADILVARRGSLSRNGSQVLVYPNLGSKAFAAPIDRRYPLFQRLLRLDPLDGRDTAYPMLGDLVSTVGFAAGDGLPPSRPDLAIRGVILNAEADLNGDGIRDVVAADLFAFTPRVRIYPGLPQQGFGPAIVQVQGPGGSGDPNGALVGDFNGDRRPDLLLSFHDGSGSNPTQLLLSGMNGLAPPVAGPTLPDGGSSPFRPQGAADLDGDGDLDLVAHGPSTQVVYLNDGAGTFTALAPTTIPEPSLDLILADMDRDGQQDVVALGTNSLRVYPGLGAGLFGAPTTQSVAASLFGGLAVHDLDNDGWLDVVYGQFDTVATLMNDSTGALLAEAVIPGISGTAGRPVFTDIDRDGSLDMARFNPDGPFSSLAQITLAFGIGPGQVAEVQNHRSWSTSAYGAILDVDLDGLLDIADPSGRTTQGVLPNQRGGRK